MKKSLIICLIALLFTMCLPTIAFASSTTEQSICQLAQQNPNVIKANCVVYQRYCLVALQTKNILTKTEYKQYTEKLEGQIKNEYEIDNVFFTRSPKIMNEIDNLNKLDSKQRQEKIQQILDKYQNKPMPLPYFYEK